MLCQCNCDTSQGNIDQEERSSVIDGGTLREGGGRGLEEKERLRYYDIDKKNYCTPSSRTLIKLED